MENTIYTQLQEQLDQYSFGFPKTDSGVEIALLKMLFTEEEADMYLNLSMEHVTAESLAQSLSLDPEKVAALLTKMFEKGLVFRMSVNGMAQYSAAPFMVGIYENQVHRMDKAFAALIEEYFQEAYFEQFAKLPVPFSRILPVNQAIATKPHHVTTFQEAGDYIRTQDRFAVAECICKKQQGQIDDPCDKPTEVCMAFGWYADYLIEAKIARRIDREEASVIQQQCDAAGLVTLSGNASDPIVFCHCCSCCCLALRAFRRLDRPAEAVLSHYSAEVIESACIGCEICIARCPMAAVTLIDDGVAAVDRGRCIGCGVCMAGCEVDAIRFQLKSDTEKQPAPGPSSELVVKLAQARGTTLIPLYRKGSCRP